MNLTRLPGSMPKVGALLGLALLLLWPRPASALPTFAQAYGIDCSACHTMVPALNAYGRYIQSTAFGALDPAVLKRVIPIVVRESVSYRSTGKLDKLEPADKWTFGNLSVNLVGLLGKTFSYRLEQSLYSNNVSGGNTGHFWVSYNQIFGGDGHLVVGKFDPPAPPAFSYWQDMSGFSSSSIAVGQHAYQLGGQRWGVGFNYVPSGYTTTPFKAQLAYLGNSPPMYNSSTFDSNNPYTPGGAGSDKAFQYKVAWARPDRPVEAGVYGAVGTYILSNGYVNPVDNYNAVGGYVQVDPSKGLPGVLFFYQQTTDSSVGPGRASQSLNQGATSWAWAIEFDESILNGDVMFGIRPAYLFILRQRRTPGLEIGTRLSGDGASALRRVRHRSARSEYLSLSLPHARIGRSRSLERHVRSTGLADRDQVGRSDLPKAEVNPHLTLKKVWPAKNAGHTLFAPSAAPLTGAQETGHFSG